ncbi:MAG: hypothetical protein KGI87_11250 [Burkholderiales bacterium]|nr:hypothetical protein [Burkholderiales bacterium]
MRATVGAATGAAAENGRTGQARLPFTVALGPYHLSLEWRDATAMRDRRRLACLNLDEQCIELRRDLRGMKLAEAFLACLIRLSHFSKGCQQGCVEEAYAQGFATGMVEFALRNPQAWLWFNLLLSEHLPGHVGYDRAVRGALAQAPSMPRRVLVGGMPVSVRGISRSQTGNAFGWYDFERREVQLYVGLSGTNLPIVALHELTHAVHHAYELRPRDTHQRFQRTQLHGWLGIMRDNPGAWRWLAWAMSFPAQAHTHTRAQPH